MNLANIIRITDSSNELINSPENLENMEIFKKKTTKPNAKHPPATLVAPRTMEQIPEFV